MLLNNGYGTKDKLFLVMIQEIEEPSKDLLIKDLCARLPYGVVIQEKCLGHDETFFPYIENNKVINIDVHEDLVITGGGSWYYIEDIKPYLLPLSSMTEEQRQELESLMEVITIPIWGEILSPTSEYYDWLNKNHFDYKGLIEKELAIDATNLNIY